MDGSVARSPVFAAAVLRVLFQADVPDLLLKERIISQALVGRMRKWRHFSALRGRRRVRFPLFLKRACKSLGLPNYGWHSFRHRIASKKIAEGATILEVMNFLGHENIEVTQGSLQELTGRKL